MIKFSAQNVLVHYVSDYIEIASKSGGEPFYKRELVIDDSWDKDGKHYSSFVLIEFSGDRMNQLDSVFAGHRVNVEAIVSGREYNGRIFNSIRGLSVSPVPAQQPYGAAPMPGAYPPPPQYGQQPYGYPPAASAYPQSPAPAYGQQPYGQQGMPGVNDLPAGM